jgi:hypothetical protein
VLDEGAAAEREPQRVDDQRPLGEHGVPVGQPERVHVRGVLDHVPRDDPPVAVPGLADDPVLAARLEAREVVDHVAAGVQVRVRGRQVPAGGLLRRPATQRLERLRIELDGQRRLGHRQEPVADALDVTFALSVSSGGANIEASRLNSDRHGSVANSP